jgi:DNA-binding response OmpR family regulator
LPTRNIFLLSRNETVQAELEAAAFPHALLHCTKVDELALDAAALVIADGDTELYSQIRKAGFTNPVLAVVADPSDGIRCLELGADSYILLPVDARELSARIIAIERRMQVNGQPLQVRVGELCIDFARGSVFRGSIEISVSNKEMSLLRYLLARRGTTVTRQELLRNVWHYQALQTRTVDFHVASLRKKLRWPGLIETVPRIGYRISLL